MRGNKEYPARIRLVLKRQELKLVNELYEMAKDGFSYDYLDKEADLRALQYILYGR